MTESSTWQAISVLIKTSDAGQRLDPTEITAITANGGGAGSSGLTGIQTRVLKGDPTKPGLYTIQLTVPANTTIKAHLHPDDRIATVISGTWYIGYGDSFNSSELKALPAGSFYTEPSHRSHFAETRDEDVIVQITGVAPSSTRYIDPATDPKRGPTKP